MKKLLLSLTLFTLLLFSSHLLIAQGPPPNPPNNPNEGGGGPIGGGAPIGSGTLLLVSLAAVYGARKYHAFIKKEELEE